MRDSFLLEFIPDGDEAERLIKRDRMHLGMEQERRVAALPSRSNHPFHETSPDPRAPPRPQHGDPTDPSRGKEPGCSYWFPPGRPCEKMKRSRIMFVDFPLFGDALLHDKNSAAHSEKVLAMSRPGNHFDGEHRGHDGLVGNQVAGTTRCKPRVRTKHTRAKIAAGPSAKTTTAAS